MFLMYKRRAGRIFHWRDEICGSNMDARKDAHLKDNMENQYSSGIL